MTYVIPVLEHVMEQEARYIYHEESIRETIAP